MSLFVTDGNHRATLAVVRALGRAGIKVAVGQEESSSIAGRSRYCATMVRYPSPLTEGPAFKLFLRDEMRSGRYAVLLPMTDITTNHVAEDAAELRQFIHLPLPELARIRKAQDKGGTLALAQGLGIACPATVSAMTGGAVEQALETLSFPMVLKPRFSRVFQGVWRYGEVQYANDRDELISKYQAAHSEIPYPLIQEKIEGEGRGMFLLLWNGELKAAFAHVRLREKPPSGGVSVCCKSIPLDKTLLEQSYMLLREIGWQGPAMVEFKVDRRDGQPKFMEINGRLWGSLQLAIDAGLNFPLLLYHLALGKSVPYSADYRIGVKNRWLLGDLDHLIMRLRTPPDIDGLFFPNKSKIGAVLEFLRFYERDLYYSDLHYDDLNPFLLECKKYLGRVYRKVPISCAILNPSRTNSTSQSRGPDSNGPFLAMVPKKQVERISRVDYDIHGIVGVRLIDPLPGDVAAVTRQIGALQKPLSREPDIIIRFIEHLPTGHLRFVELNRTGFSENGFFVLESGKHKARVRLPFEQIGKQCEIVCESGLRAIPHLMAIVNLTALTKDVVALHASAFVYADAGVVVTGWAKGGKTEALLAFASRGASYIGDEWLLLSGDGRHMYGIPENIRLWEWHLRNLPYLQSAIPFEKRLLFASIHFLHRIERGVLNKFFGKTLPARALREAMPALKRQLNIRFDPQTIFRGKIGSCPARPDKVFFMMNHDSNVVTVEPTDARDIAERMISSVRFEQLPIMGDYLAFKFAFPKMRNEVLEHAHEMQYSILQRALSGKEAYTVRHPYPVALNDLYEVMHPCVERARSQTADSRRVQLAGVSHSYSSPEVA